MANLRVSVDVGSLDGAHWRTVVALADTGSSHTALPASCLRELGVEPVDTATFRLIDGTERVYQMGVARLRLEGRESYSRVAFVEEDTEPRLGFVTLADMCLEVDPDTHGLVSAAGYLLPGRPQSEG